MQECLDNLFVLLCEATVVNNNLFVLLCEATVAVSSYQSVSRVRRKAITTLMTCGDTCSGRYLVPILTIMAPRKSDIPEATIFTYANKAQERIVPYVSSAKEAAVSTAVSAKDVAISLVLFAKGLLDKYPPVKAFIYTLSAFCALPVAMFIGYGLITGTIILTLASAIVGITQGGFLAVGAFSIFWFLMGGLFLASFVTFWFTIGYFVLQVNSFTYDRLLKSLNKSFTFRVFTVMRAHAI